MKFDNRTARRFKQVAMVVFSAIAVCVQPAGYAQSVEGQTQQAERPFVPGRLLVKFKEGVSDDAGRGVLSANQARSTRVLDGIGVHVVELPAQANERALQEILKGQPEVEFAELDRIVAPSAINPNDPYYPTNWHLFKISAPSAWSVTTGTSSVVIAIVDTGVDGTHQDLLANLVPGWNVVNNNSNTSDTINHGTESAGIAAEVTNNTLGSAGICWTCKIMPVRVTNDSYGYATSSNVASGLTWAADHGARVAAVGYAFTGDATANVAAQYFYNRGGVVIMPAGNFGTFDATADNPYVLTVGSTDNSDVRYSWSNTGNNIDLVAPGCVQYTPAPVNSWAMDCGTSASAAIVAGVAALVRSVNAALTPAQVTSILKQSVDDLGTVGWDSTFGSGRINALKAVNNASSGGSTKTNTSTTLTSSLNPSTFGQLVTFRASVTPSAATGTVTFSDGATTLGTGTLIGGIATLATSSLSAGSHSISASYGGNSSYNGSTSAALTQTVNTTSKTNTSTILASSLNPSNSGQSVTFTATVSPSTATGTVTFLDGTATFGSATLSSGRATFSTSSVTVGTHSIKATYNGNTSYNGSTSAALAQTVTSTTTTDTTPPTAPSNLRAASLSNVQAALIWTASTDNVGVAGYKVFRQQLTKGPKTASAQIGTSTTASYADNTVKSGVTYAYTVSAYDAKGNVSAASNMFTVVAP